MYVTTWPINKRGNKWEMLSYEAWMDGRTAVCHNKPVFWRAYNNEWPISWNYEYINFGQIIFQNFHQFKAFVGLSDCRIIATAPFIIPLKMILIMWLKVHNTEQDFLMFKYMINIIWYGSFRITSRINPRAKALGMILVSRVDTGCDTERAIYYSPIYCNVNLGTHVCSIQHGCFIWFIL
jgi:hypothetical protein